MQDELVQRIQDAVAELVPEITELRHELHAVAEVHPNETATREQLAQALARVPNLTVWEPLIGTDLIAELEGQGDATIVLRADIDALPILEDTGKPYCSRNDGVMHACGHDGHAAMLVGAVKVLAQVQDLLPVTVRFVFQPGEEIFAAGKTLVERGACRGAEAAFALHGWPWLPVGAIASLPGPMFAAAAFFRMEFTGISGHAASPPAIVASPLLPAARAVDAIEALRMTAWENDRAIVTAACLQAGQASNVIPETAVLEGTVRYFEEAVGDRVAAALRELAAAAVEDSPVTVEMTFEKDYPLPVINTDAGFRHIERTAREVLPEHWQILEEPSMGAEDFAFYLPGREGGMFRLGLGVDRPKLHTPQFDFNDAALANGMLMHCMLALRYGS